ncbi:hypothetical protein B0J13DRAFT_531016 [Dactylonectria estremocensis]|uniref:Fucose-specific lectin n=1 Tax=Dactylonectria estremocensis TaxID=1079267 RepID=A0A9P9DVG7_9HYPO|nr:hypothetical protein B0J13DRAFT_531016 [Dactylonectria estremocensis]
MTYWAWTMRRYPFPHRENIRVFVLTTGNIINELEIDHPDKDTPWKRYRPGRGESLVTGNGSNIAAWRLNTGKVDDTPIVVVYQDGDRHLVHALSTNPVANDWTKVSMNGLSVAMTSGLAFTSFARDGNVSDIEWRFYIESNSQLMQVFLEPGSSNIDPFAFIFYSWFGKDQKLAVITSAPKTNFAGVCFDLTDLIVANINNNGGVIARWWDASEGDNWTSDEIPSIPDTPEGIEISEGFTAISGHGGRRMYGIVSGEIHEWSFESEAPLEWNYKGQVNTTLGGSGS